MSSKLIIGERLVHPAKVEGYHLPTLPPLMLIQLERGPELLESDVREVNS
ncbi:hypothetical protein LINPERPRIM_LOCUS41120 [Linum perenne]